MRRAAPETTDDGGDDRGVQTVLNRQAGDQGIGHRLRDGHHRHGQAGEEVGLDVTLAVTADPGDERNEVIEVNVHRCILWFNLSETGPVGRKSETADGHQAVVLDSNPISTGIDASDQPS